MTRQTQDSIRGLRIRLAQLHYFMGIDTPEEERKEGTPATFWYAQGLEEAIRTIEGEDV